jgi:four helix bundle protein
VKPKTYKDLLIWKNAFHVSLLIIKLLNELPKNTSHQVIKYQVTRSSMSIGANIAEGYGRYGPKEYQRYMQISLGSANETDYWLLILRECFPKYSKRIEIITNKNTESIKMLAASLKTMRKK